MLPGAAAAAGRLDAEVELIVALLSFKNVDLFERG